MQAFPVGQSLFSVQGCAGALTQAIFADGFGTKPSPHEQRALWFDTVQRALGPQGCSRQGLIHLLLRHDSPALQSSSAWQPKMHMFCLQMYPKKQSLSTRHVNLQVPLRHFSLKAQSSSMEHWGLQMLS